MSIAQRNEIEELKRRVAALESYLGAAAKEYVERHFDKVVAHYAGKPDDPVTAKTIARTTLTLPEKRKSA